MIDAIGLLIGAVARFFRPRRCHLTAKLDTDALRAKVVPRQNSIRA